MTTGECKLTAYIANVVNMQSTWTMVFMTCHRAVAILWPHRAKVFSTTKMVVSLLSALTAFSFIFHSHKAYGFEVRTGVNPGDWWCTETYTGGYRAFIESIWSPIELAVVFFLPFALILVSDVVLVKTVIVSIRDARRRVALNNIKTMDKREKQVSSMIILMVVTSAMFFFLMLPIRTYGFFTEIISESVGVRLIGRCLQNDGVDPSRDLHQDFKVSCLHE
ncbi:uncharacterized protein LOC112572178 [Pomacea canaliculata]|uniref:uncharacterized protein LOC112572178 n=1 Tax=Pomacea canaliculata TaxID=400727 RepID=UPI000D73EBFE|nr:uncharacterized protein LOC112572178 [Pomacea canaliculata]